MTPRVLDLRVASLAALLVAFLVAGAAAPAAAASTTQKKLAGSGPIDRPTAHTNGWTFRDWSHSLCPGAVLDSFVADGDSAVVRWTVRNRRDGYQPPTFRLDNVVVLERSVYESNLRALGSDLVLLYSSVVNPATLALDFVPLLPDQVVYHADFAGAIGPEWSYDPTQVSWESAYQHPDVTITGVMFDDPFTPEFDRDGEFYSDTGEMRIGNGTGPEYVSVDLQLSGLVAGTEYVVTYWSRSLYLGTTNVCIAPNAEWEVEIFGEELVCRPDPPQFVHHDIRTLSWDPGTGLWRFQLEFENVDGGPVVTGAASETNLELTLVPLGAEVVEGTTTLPDLAPGERGWSGPLELDMAGRVPSSVVDLRLDVSYSDDCGGPGGTSFALVLPGPAVAPTAAPGAPRGFTVRTAPNPFNPRTSIRLELPDEGRVRIEVVDLRGHRVRHLLDARRPAGSLRVIWDGRDDAGRESASGVYLIVARHDDQLVRHKVALVR